MTKIGIVNKESNILQEMRNISDNLISLEEHARQDVELGNLLLAIDYVYGEAYQTDIEKIYALDAVSTLGIVVDVTDDVLRHDAILY